MSTTTEGQKGPSSIATPKFKRGLKGFLSETSREMKKVNWPTKKETNRLTFVVIALCIAIALILGGMGLVANTLVTLVNKGRV